MKKSLIRIYHPYWLWEETKHNMWGSVENEDLYIKMAIDFMKDTELFGGSMQLVTEKWKYSCEHNLTNISQNRVAWIGQSACALYNKIPESIVRQAWWFLTDEDREKANNKAKEAIKKWEVKQLIKQNEQEKNK